eukprot:403349842
MQLQEDFIDPAFLNGSVDQQPELNQDLNYFTDQNLIQAQQEVQSQQNLKNDKVLITQKEKQQERPISPLQSKNTNPIGNLMEQLKKPQTAQQNGNNQQDFNAIDGTLGVGQNGNQEQQRPQTSPIVTSSLPNQSNVMETLAKNFAKKLNQKKVQKSVQEDTKQSINDLRNEFQLQLAKVYENHTRKEGTQACFRIIQRNVDNPQALRVILGALCDRSSQVANSDKKPQGLMFHVQMFGFVAKCFKTELIDPLHPTLIRTVIKIQEAIYSFFKENSKIVWKGCAVSLADIIDNCFPDKNILINGNQSLMSFIFDPLMNYHKGGHNTMMQQGASFCIMHLIEHFQTQGCLDFLEQIHLPIISTTTKFKVDNESQLIAVKLLIQHLGIRVAKDYIEGLITISNKVIGMQQSVTNAFHKQAACDLLTILGQNLKEFAAHIVPTYQGDVMKALESIASEKQIDLSESRNKAKQAWIDLQKIYEEIDPSQKQNMMANIMSQNFQNNKYSKLRDQAKETREIQKRSKSDNSRVMNDFIQDEINQSYRMISQGFLKKGKGQGGGLAMGNVNFSPSQSKDKKLYEELKRISELNSFMRGNSPRASSLSPSGKSQHKLADMLPEIDESHILPHGDQSTQQMQPMNKIEPNRVQQQQKRNDIVSINTDQYLSPRSAVQNYPQQKTQVDMQPHQQRLNQLNQQNFGNQQRNVSGSPNRQSAQSMMQQMGFNGGTDQNQFMASSQEGLQQLAQMLQGEQQYPQTQGVVDQYGQQQFLPQVIQQLPLQTQNYLPIQQIYQGDPLVDPNTGLIVGYQQVPNNFNDQVQTPLFQGDQLSFMPQSQTIPQNYPITQQPHFQNQHEQQQPQPLYQGYGIPQQQQMPQADQQVFQDSLQPNQAQFLQQQPLQQYQQYPGIQQQNNIQNPLLDSQVQYQFQPLQQVNQLQSNQMQSAVDQYSHQVLQQNQLPNQEFEGFEEINQDHLIGNQAFNNQSNQPNSQMNFNAKTPQLMQPPLQNQAISDYQSPIRDQLQQFQHPLNQFSSPIQNQQLRPTTQDQLESSQQQHYQLQNQQLSQNPFVQQQVPLQQEQTQPSLQQQQQQLQSKQDIFSASPNTQQRYLEEQRHQLKQAQSNMLQRNPQLNKYQQHKEFLEDKMFSKPRENVVPQQVQQEQQQQIGFVSDPTDIDGDLIESQRQEQLANEVFMDSLQQPNLNQRSSSIHQIQNQSSQQPIAQNQSNQRIPQMNQPTNYQQKQQTGQHALQQRMSSPFIEKELPLIKEEDPDIDNCESDINDRDMHMSNLKPQQVANQNLQYKEIQNSNFQSQPQIGSGNISNINPPQSNSRDNSLILQEQQKQLQQIPLQQKAINTNQISGKQVQQQNPLVSQQQVPQAQQQNFNLKDTQRKIIIAPVKQQDPLVIQSANPQYQDQFQANKQLLTPLQQQQQIQSRNVPPQQQFQESQSLAFQQAPQKLPPLTNQPSLQQLNGHLNQLQTQQLPNGQQLLNSQQITPTNRAIANGQDNTNLLRQINPLTPLNQAQPLNPLINAQNKPLINSQGNPFVQYQIQQQPYPNQAQQTNSQLPSQNQQLNQLQTQQKMLSPQNQIVQGSNFLLNQVPSQNLTSVMGNPGVLSQSQNQLQGFNKNLVQPEIINNAQGQLNAKVSQQMNPSQIQNQQNQLQQQQQQQLLQHQNMKPQLQQLPMHQQTLPPLINQQDPVQQQQRFQPQQQLGLTQPASFQNPNYLMTQNQQPGSNVPLLNMNGMSQNQSLQQRPLANSLPNQQQQQMEQGFSKMCDKIEDIEGRVDNASNQLQQFERQQVDNQRMQEQKDFDNQQIFRRLSDTLNSQNQQMLQQRTMGQPTDFARDEREPRFRPQDYSQSQILMNQPLPMSTIQNVQGQIPSKSPQRQYQSKLIQVWNKVLELVKKRQFEEAYRLTMKEADDIYLIRLVAQTGPVVKQLEDKTAFQVINRINKIIRSGAFEAMEIEWIEDASRRGLFQQLSKHEQNEYLDTLYQFSQSKLNQKISTRATQVYQQIKNSAANNASNNVLPNRQ